jgi:Uncharacterised protein family (UPF0137)
MSNLNLFSNPAFQTQDSHANKFNLVTQANTFNAVFNTQPLEESEALNLERMVLENLQMDAISEEQAHQDIHQLKQITAEIKSIGQQGVILMGERIHRAREILKLYKDGTFTQWLESTLGSKKTGYNMLAYYELYKELPSEGLKEEFKKIPQKAAYILASREGDIGEKVKIIRFSHHLKTQEIISLIQKEFPSKSHKRTKNTEAKMIQSIREMIHKIHGNRKYLSKDDKDELLSIKLVIENILKA